MADLAIQKKTVTPQQLKAVIRQGIVDGDPEFAPFLGRLQAKYKGNLTDEALVKEYVSAFPKAAEQFDFGGVDLSSGVPAAVAPAPGGSAFRGPSEAPRPLGSLAAQIPGGYAHPEASGQKASLWEAANVPMLEPARPLLGEVSTRIGERIFGVEAARAQGKKSEPSQEVAVGATQGLTEAGIDLSSPLNAGMMVGLAKIPWAALASRGKNVATAMKGAKLLMSLYFGGSMGYSALQEFPAAAAAYQAGDYRGAGREATKAAIDALFSIGALKGAKTGIPQAEIDAARARRGTTSAPPPTVGGGAPPPPGAPPPGAPGAGVPPASGGPPADPWAPWRKAAGQHVGQLNAQKKPYKTTASTLAKDMRKDLANPTEAQEVRDALAYLRSEEAQNSGLGYVDAGDYWVPPTSAPKSTAQAAPAASAGKSAPIPFNPKWTPEQKQAWADNQVGPEIGIESTYGRRAGSISAPVPPAAATPPTGAPPPAAGTTPATGRQRGPGGKFAKKATAPEPTPAAAGEERLAGMKKQPGEKYAGWVKRVKAEFPEQVKGFDKDNFAFLWNTEAIKGATPPPAAEAKVEPLAGPPPGTTPPTAESAGGATPAQPETSAAPALTSNQTLAQQLTAGLAALKAKGKDFGKEEIGTNFWLQDFVKRHLGLEADSWQMARVLNEAKASVGRGDPPEAMRGVIEKVLDEITNWWNPSSPHLKDPMEDPSIVRPLEATDIPEAPAAPVEAPKISRFRGTVEGKPSLYYPTAEAAQKAGVQDVREVLVDAPVVPPKAEAPISRAQELFAPAERRYNRLVNEPPAEPGSGYSPESIANLGRDAIARAHPIPEVPGSPRQLYAERMRLRSPQSAPEPYSPGEPTLTQKALEDTGFKYRQTVKDMPREPLPSGSKDYDIYDLPAESGTLAVDYDPVTGEWRSQKYYPDRTSLSDSGFGLQSLEAHLKKVKATEVPLKPKPATLPDLAESLQEIRTKAAGLTPRQDVAPNPNVELGNALEKSRASEEMVRTQILEQAQRAHDTIVEGSKQLLDQAQALRENRYGKALQIKLLEVVNRANAETDPATLEEIMKEVNDLHGEYKKSISPRGERKRIAEAEKLEKQYEEAVAAAPAALEKVGKQYVPPPLADISSGSPEAQERLGALVGNVKFRPGQAPGMPPERLSELYNEQIPYDPEAAASKKGGPRGSLSGGFEGDSKLGYNMPNGDFRLEPLPKGYYRLVRKAGERNPEIKLGKFKGAAEAQADALKRQAIIDRNKVSAASEKTQRSARKSAPQPVTVAQPAEAPVPVEATSAPAPVVEVPPTLPATVAKAVADKVGSAPAPVQGLKITSGIERTAPEPGLQPGRTYTSPAGSDELGILSGDRLTYLGREGQVAKFRDADTGSVVRITAADQELMPVLGVEAPVGPPPVSEGRRATQRGSWSEKPAEGEPPSWADAEKDAIQRAIAFTGGNIKAAAQHLGMGRTSIYRKMQQYGLAAREFLKDETGEAKYRFGEPPAPTGYTSWVSPEGKVNAFKWGVDGTHADAAAKILKIDTANLSRDQKITTGNRAEYKLEDQGWMKVHGSSVTTSEEAAKTKGFQEAVRAAEQYARYDDDSSIKVRLGEQYGNVPLGEIPDFLRNPLVWIRRYRNISKSEPAPVPMGMPEPVLA